MMTVINRKMQKKMISTYSSVYLSIKIKAIIRKGNNNIGENRTTLASMLCFLQLGFTLNGRKRSYKS